MRKFEKGQRVRYIGDGPWYGSEGIVDQYTSKTRCRVLTETSGYTTREEDLEAVEADDK
jgi:hypothetical protein